MPHWHYVTWGLSELHEKEANNLQDVSGWVRNTAVDLTIAGI